MEPERLREACVEACDEYLGYVRAWRFVKPDLGLSSCGVVSARVRKGYAVLRTEQPLREPDGLVVRVGDEAVPERDARVERVDSRSRTAVVRLSDDGLALLGSMPGELSLAGDMTFIVERARAFYESYGTLIRPPSPDVPFSEEEVVFPEGEEPSDEQRAAVRRVLDGGMSYVWGAPGTGKTQFVLATCLLSCLSRGERVAVVSPTNSALEQVVRGVVAAVGGGGSWEGLGILRLGVATKGFVDEFPGMCERRGLDAEARDVEGTLANVRDVLMERRIDDLRPRLEEAARLSASRDGMDPNERRRADVRLRGTVSSCRRRLEACGGPVDALGAVTIEGMPASLDLAMSRLYGRPRPALDMEEYQEMGETALASLARRLERRLAELVAEEPRFDTSTARVLAMTPQTLMSRFRPKGSEGDKEELRVDRIFLDEAGYCSLLNALPLFAFGVPVAMLGDHKQLPPVCEIDREALEGALVKGRSELAHAFLWDMSALFCEQAMADPGLSGLEEAYLGWEDPVFRTTSLSSLTASHRFGDNLARVLDRRVYRNGIRGASDHPLDLVCIDRRCADPKEDSRENPEEAEAVRDFLESEGLTPSDAAVLTPYKDQLRELKSVLPRRFNDSVMTVHRSQGREWDTVVLSVADGEGCRREVPYRFTSTADPRSIGTNLINTAVSRAKRRLVVVCDAGFWASRDGELIGDLVREARLADPVLTDVPDGMD